MFWGCTLQVRKKTRIANSVLNPTYNISPQQNYITTVKQPSIDNKTKKHYLDFLQNLKLKGGHQISKNKDMPNYNILISITAQAKINDYYLGLASRVK